MENQSTEKLRAVLSGPVIPKKVWYTIFFFIVFTGAVGTIFYAFVLLPSQRETDTTRIPQVLHGFGLAQFEYLEKNDGNYTEYVYDEFFAGKSPDQFPKYLPAEAAYAQKTGEPYMGYLFSTIVITRKTEQKGAAFAIIVVPAVTEGPFRTGEDCFFLDQTGVIRHSGSPTKVPHALCPPLFNAEPEPAK